MATTNCVFFPAISSVSPPLGTSEKWRICTKTSNLYDNILTTDMVFRYSENNSQFNLTNKYMTLFHIGAGSSVSGIAVCLYRASLDSNPIQIGLRISSGTAWSDLAGSFVSLSSIGNVSSDAFMIMLQYNYTGSNTIVNFYVVQYNNTTTKTTPDFSFTTTSASDIQPIGNQWGFGSSPESITTTDGFTNVEGYNSYVAQNVSLINIRTWDIFIPVSSSVSGTYAMFNTNASFSLYNLNKSTTYVPRNTANLNFQLYIPTGSFSISQLANNNKTADTLVTLGTSSTAFQTLDGFSINSASGYNAIAANDVPCLLKGTEILTTEGYKLIELITTDDILVTHDNRLTKVIQNKMFNAIGNLNTYPYVIQSGKYNAYKDLFISGGHAILIDNYFVSAYHLDLSQDTNFSLIEYYCLETEDFYKDTIIANGVVVETWDGFDLELLYNGVEHNFLDEYINENGHRYLRDL